MFFYAVKKSALPRREPPLKIPSESLLPFFVSRRTAWNRLTEHPIDAVLFVEKLPNLFAAAKTIIRTVPVRRRNRPAVAGSPSISAEGIFKSAKPNKISQYRKNISVLLIGKNRQIIIGAMIRVGVCTCRPQIHAGNSRAEFKEFLI